MNFPALTGFGAGLVVAGAFAVALAHGPSVPASGSGTPTTTTPVAPRSNTDSADQVYNHAKNSVAFISADTPNGTATGSGFVVSKDGRIVTNAHVVEGAQQVSVKLGTSGQAQSANVLAVDTSKDLALLKINAGGNTLAPLSFADSSKLQVGDTAYAIGNPFGLDHTFTSGIVSGLDREIQSPDGTAIKGVVQTDAAINPGNSGGALLNAGGQVIGINSQIASASNGGESGNVGIGFAIPSNTVVDYIAHPTSNQQAPQPLQLQAQPSRMLVVP